MTTVITGGTGLIGRGLLAKLPNATVLTRDPARAVARLGAVDARLWRPEEGPAPVEALAGADVIFNLAGEPVASGRWSAERKRRIRDSRVLGTRNLVAGLAAHEHRPRVLVSASAVGVYGDRADEVLDEDSAPGEGFLADVCAEWEAEAMAATRLGIRVVCVRIGVVLAPDGGALTRMMTPFRMGVGGRLASGKQWMPWVHVDDVVGLLLLAAQTPEIRGPINAVAPEPAQNAEFVRAFGQAIGRPAFIPVPKTALRLALGEMSQILTASQRVVPRSALSLGYDFEYPELGSALRSASRREAT